eukprot:4470104-Alexandrium_andersonii.AAC.1
MAIDGDVPGSEEDAGQRNHELARSRECISAQLEGAHAYADAAQHASTQRLGSLEGVDPDTDALDEVSNME